MSKEGFAVKCLDVAAGLESLWMKGQKFWTSVTRHRMPSALQTIKLWIRGCPVEEGQDPLFSSCLFIQLSLEHLMWSLHNTICHVFFFLLFFSNFTTWIFILFYWIYQNNSLLTRKLKITLYFTGLLFFKTGI